MITDNIPIRISSAMPYPDWGQVEGGIVAKYKCALTDRDRDHSIDVCFEKLSNALSSALGLENLYFIFAFRPPMSTRLASKIPAHRLINIEAKDAQGLEWKTWSHGANWILGYVGGDVSMTAKIARRAFYYESAFVLTSCPLNTAIDIEPGNLRRDICSRSVSLSDIMLVPMIPFDDPELEVQIAGRKESLRSFM